MPSRKKCSGAQLQGIPANCGSLFLGKRESACKEIGERFFFAWLCFEHVLVMLLLMLLEYKAEGMSIHNDNRSQFIAQVVRAFLKEKGILQEFSHVGTPEDKAYIEAFHSNLQRGVVDRYEFDSIYHAQMVLDRYYEWYNDKRRRGAPNRLTPNHVFQNPIPFENEKLLSYL